MLNTAVVLLDLERQVLAGEQLLGLVSLPIVGDERLASHATLSISLRQVASSRPPSTQATVRR